ncbi:MAG: hypothetical protein P8Y70_21375 [Candidatus Lokiarchaeota archaeon]
MTVDLSTSNESSSTKYCIICRNSIEDVNNAYQTSINLSLVCEECQHVFSPSDLELLAGIFIAFGGYFGSLKQKNTSIEDIINSAVIKNKAKIEEINIIVLHQMLLHGFTPQEYIEKLGSLKEKY